MSSDSDARVWAFTDSLVSLAKILWRKFNFLVRQCSGRSLSDCSACWGAEIPLWELLQSSLQTEPNACMERHQFSAPYSVHHLCRAHAHWNVTRMYRGSTVVFQDLATKKAEGLGMRSIAFPFCPVARSWIAGCLSQKKLRVKGWLRCRSEMP
jgi:hypothetical protein